MTEIPNIPIALSSSEIKPMRNDLAGEESMDHDVLPCYPDFGQFSMFIAVQYVIKDSLE